MASRPSNHLLSTASTASGRCVSAAERHAEKAEGNSAQGLLLGVLELRQGFDRLPGRAGQHELAVLLLQLIRWDGHVMPPHAHEASCADDNERHRRVGGDDEVVNDSDLLLLFVI